MPDQQRVERVLLRDNVYDTILKAIVDGTLEPGEQLRDEELVRWLGSSRAPIREALKQLATERLVEMVPHKYTRVAPLDPRATFENLLLQLTLFELGMRLAIPQLTDHDKTELQDLFDKIAQTGGAETPTIARALGDYLRYYAKRSGNTSLSDFLYTYSPHLRRFLPLPESAMPNRTVVEHLPRLHELAMTGDVEGAIAVLDGVRQVILKHFIEQFPATQPFEARSS